MREQIAQDLVAKAKALQAGMGVRPRLSSSLARAGELVRSVLGVGFRGATKPGSEADALLPGAVLPPYRGRPPGQLVEAARAWAEEQVAELLKRQEAEDSRVARWRRGAQ